MMSRQAVEQALGKLVLDCEFRAAFFHDPPRAAHHAGLDLTDGERETLALIRPGALAAFNQYLDRKRTMAMLLVSESD